jgi:peptidoglycan hydrolase-like protein with peptidoglycan-binding domain
MAVAVMAAVLVGACGSTSSSSTATPDTAVPAASRADSTTTAPSTTTTVAPTTSTVAPTTTTTVPSAAVPTAPLAAGASGPAVGQLQQRLSDMGYWLPGVDGEYGAGTVHAVTAFQKANGLPRSGQADAATLAAMATAPRPTPREPIPHGLEVDLARQILMVVDGSQVSVVLDISSGKPSTPTVLGHYAIQRQIDGMDTGPLGTLWRPKYFIRGYAIHGSASVPASPASHGCVRLTNAEIDWVWASGVAPIGTSIFVY